MSKINKPQLLNLFKMQWSINDIHLCIKKRFLGLLIYFILKNHFDAAVYALALKSKTNSMVNARKYIQFKQFYEMLLALYENRMKGQTIEDLYPAVIEWCRGQVGE
jgi:hypothetical protein